MGARGRKAASWAVVTLSLLTAPKVFAAPSSLRESLPQEQRTAFDEGSKLYAEKRYVDAREAFLNVFSKSGDARVLFNVAVCEKALGRYAEAIASIERSLALLGSAATPDFSTRAKTALDALSAYVGTVRLESNVDGVTFTVDGLVAKETTVRLDSGEHTITAQKPTFSPSSQRVTVVAREQRTLRFDLAPSDPTVAVAIQCETLKPCLIDVDGVSLGNAPVRVSREPGTFRVRATVDGKPFGEKLVELVLGAPVSISLRGKLLPHLRLTTERVDDNVWIDGVLVGKGNVEADLFAGEHNVAVSSIKGQRRSLDLVLRERENRDVHLALASGEPEATSDRAGISPWWFVGGAAVLAGAAATVIYFATAPTKYEGSGAGSLNPYVVTATHPGGLYRW